ncbi:MAG: LD-carboxypeptidase [Lachnospiraceae bacterium]|nr:LD-carboxypeptidase [Lachnospiraceae bacterium]
MAIFPDKLCPGDTIGLIAPSSPVAPERVDRCIALLESMGYRVKAGEGLKQNLHEYLAGPDEVRAADVNRMFADPQVKAIFCIRGGYGSGRLMDKLNYDVIRRNPKIFVGYSDITNLSMAFYSLCGLVTYHGPMVSSNMLEHYDAYTRECFEGVLNMDEEYEYHNYDDAALVTLTGGKASGELIGGNLALLVNLLGTFYAPDVAGKILFIEDIGESLPRANRMFDQLFYTGIMDKVAGVLIGDFSDWSYAGEKEYTMMDLIRERFTNCGVPVIAGLSCGHCYPTGTLPMGAYCEMDADRKRIRFVRQE